VCVNTARGALGWGHVNTCANGHSRSDTGGGWMPLWGRVRASSCRQQPQMCWGGRQEWPGQSFSWGQLSLPLSHTHKHIKLLV
jgi:hypothetical protein